MSSMFNPPHPGLTLRDDILPALNLQVGEAAAQLGVDRTTLSKVVNGRASISPSMALRIERWLGRDHGGAAEVWLAQQAAYDLWQARVAAKASKTLSGIKAIKDRVTKIEDGASSVEWVLIVAGISVAVIAAVAVIAPWLKTEVTKATTP